MLNSKNLSVFILETLKIILISTLLIYIGCGKRKPPQPPAEHASQRTELSGKQQGNAVTLSWKLPQPEKTDGDTSNIIRVDIYRLVEPLNINLQTTEEDFVSRSTVISSVSISKSDFDREQITYNDILTFAGQNVRLWYAIRLVNSFGQKAAFSNFLLIEPAAKIASTPNLVDVNVFEEYVELKWEAPTQNVDGSRPANILGYNVYRVNNDNSVKILNNGPITQTFFVDSDITLGLDYKYFVRAASLGTNGEPVESADSKFIAVKTKDIFPPTAPSGVTIAAAPRNISLFFAINPEKDVAGYQVFRSTDSNLAIERWNLLTPTLLTTNTFQDKSVEAGKTYFYFVKAVDENGNLSPASAIVSETAP